jgi:hypothetical protein
MLDVGRTFNMSSLQPPLPDAEVAKTAASAWRYTLGGTLRHGMVPLHVPMPLITTLSMLSPDALALVAMLAAHNGKSAQFCITNSLAGSHIDFTLRRLTRARNVLLDLGIVELLCPARKGHAAVYQWGRMAGANFIALP